jgi:hypothetical protein
MSQFPQAAVAGVTTQGVPAGLARSQALETLGEQPLDTRADRIAFDAVASVEPLSNEIGLVRLEIALFFAAHRSPRGIAHRRRPAWHLRQPGPCPTLVSRCRVLVQASDCRIFRCRPFVTHIGEVTLDFRFSDRCGNDKIMCRTSLAFGASIEGRPAVLRSKHQNLSAKYVKSASFH